MPQSPHSPVTPSLEESPAVESRIPPDLAAPADRDGWIVSCGWALWYAAVLLILLLRVGPVFGG